MADTDPTKCSCLEVFGEDPDCPLHGTDALEVRIAELEATIANSDYAHLISVITDIRMKSGVGAKPMLDELADAIAAQLTASRAECEGLRAKLNACRWYWPEDDTSEDCCAESAQEIVQNAYDWTSKYAGGIVAVARGGVVEVTYCAMLPPADDADSDDDFWVEEQTGEAAQTKIDAEKARRAALSQKETDDAT